jgi:hypothetical protein
VFFSPLSIHLDHICRWEPRKRLRRRRISNRKRQYISSSSHSSSESIATVTAILFSFTVADTCALCGVILTAWAFTFSAHTEEIVILGKNYSTCWIFLPRVTSACMTESSKTFPTHQSFLLNKHAATKDVFLSKNLQCPPGFSESCHRNKSGSKRDRILYKLRCMWTVCIRKLQSIWDR